MADSAINGHDPVTTWDWARNFLTQAASGAESGAIGSGAKHRWMSLEELRGLIVEITNVVNNVTTEVPSKVLDARQGKVLADAIQAEIAKYAQPNGIATLGSDGKVLASQIPSLALVDVFTVESEAAMLALDAEQGDMAIRTDSNQVFILSASPASTLANWIELAALKALVDAAIADLAGVERTIETVKGNADAIALKFDKSAVKSTPSATPLDTNALSEKYIVDNLALKTVTDEHETRLSGLDTLVYEGKTYRVSKRIENGHLVTTYTEVI